MNRLRNFFTVLFVAVFVGVFPALGNAQVFEECSDTKPCNCTDADTEGADDCVEFTEADLVDVSDPAAVREAYLFESTFDSETNTHHVSGEIGSARTRALPVHPSDGQWETVEDVEWYLTNAFGLDPALDFSEGDEIQLTFDGAYGRYHEDTGDWAADQSCGSWRDFVSSENCRLEIQGDEAHCVRDNRNKECMTKGFAATFSAMECSGVCTFHLMDQDWPEYDSWSVIKDVMGSEFRSTFREGTNGKFLVMLKHADRLDLTAKYYNSSGNYYGEDSAERLNTGHLEIGFSSSGICGIGEAENGTTLLDFHTEAGNARGNCN